MPASRNRLAGAAALALVASGLLLLPAAPASAVTGVFISELHYDNDGTDVGEFVEVTAPAGTDLTGYKIVLYNGSNGATYTPTTTLNGVVVEQQDGWGAVATDISGIQNGAPDGLALVNSSDTVLEFISYEGSLVATNGPANGQTATDILVSQSGTDPAGQSLQRLADGSWTGPAANTKGAPNGFTTGDDPEPTPLTATSPGDQTGMVGVVAQPITLTASGGAAPYTWEISGLPAGLVESEEGVITGAPTTAGDPVTVTATVTDDDGAEQTVTFGYTVDEYPEITPIAEIQGSGARSPLAPESGNGSGAAVVSTEGVVTARYATGGLNGMYIQTPAVDTEDSSDGIFVYGGGGDANISDDVEVGDSVVVTGKIAEFYNLTQIIPASVSAVGVLAADLGVVEPREIAYPTTDEAREAREGELLEPTGDFTVTNNYSANQYAEIGLATGTTPLRQPTEYAAPTDTDAINEIKDDNYARGVVLDDGQTTNFLGNNTNKAIPLPWLTPTNPIRVGAAVTFTGPVVLDWRNDSWKFEPTRPVTDDGADVATFEDTREDNLRPRDVEGDLTIATFNVLNYFNTTGEAYAAAGPEQDPPLDTFCTYYRDRGPGTTKAIGNNSCGVRLLDDPDTEDDESDDNDGRGPRGAATAESLERQEDKLAHTINELDADIVGLEEVENSIKLPGETNRDDALARIVEILNEDARDEDKWAYVKSPGEALTASAVAEQDVIRGAFIYQRDSVAMVGQSDMLFGTTQFANAREPLAQAFKAKGAPDSDAFAVIVNHFKSKGDNADPAPPAADDNANDTETGVGAFNGDRIRQARRLVQFAEDFAAERGIEAVFLAGDFNSYTMEKPIEVLTEEGGFELVESDDPEDESYSYSGLSGSLDHVLGNPAAMAMSPDADIWEINADESPAFQYSRYNYNATNFWQPDLPFATSDHNPEIVGIDVPDFTPVTYKEIQVLGTNDFHGRLLPDAGNAAGAAPFATAVEELRQENPNTVFVAAGDLIGASTFESFVQEDTPTIEALNAMGLEVSAAGNHEFDRGYADLEGRVQDMAAWEYIASNLEYDESIAGEDQLAKTFTKTIDGVRIGFVGAVTEDLPALVNPEGIEGITVTDIVDAVGQAAEELKTGPDAVDLVILLVHEGSPSTECASMTDEATTWGHIAQNTSADVDAIISGHTHLAYNCRFPVDEWSGRAVTKRPVVSAGQYGTNLNQLVFKFASSGDLAAISQDVIAAAGVGYEPDPEVKGIVDDAVAVARDVGGDVLGKMDGPFQRAEYTSSAGATENRGGESTLGNQVAEVQRWATAEAGVDTDIAFMNPGGLRADMAGTLAGDALNLTYRQAADVQPFANTLVNMRLTGAQIETVLEQQWQRNAQGGVPSRPFLRLGVSEGFTYTYEETPETVRVPNSAPVTTTRGEVTGMWLDGEPIRPAATYGVTVNSFLATGGDNFWELANGAGKVDTGKVDLEAMVDYMAHYEATPLAVDYAQRAVGVTFPDAAPAEYEPGDTVSFNLSSLAMSATGDVHDSELLVALDGTDLGTATVDNTIGNKPYDDYGRAAVEVTLPDDLSGGEVELTARGVATGTEVIVPITIAGDDPGPGPGPSTTPTSTSATAQAMTWGTDGVVNVSVTPATATGAVTVSSGAAQLGSGAITNGTGTVTIDGEALEPGSHTLTVRYAGNSTHDPSQATVTLQVAKATTSLSATTAAVDHGAAASVAVAATPATAEGPVTVAEGGTTLGQGTLTDGADVITIPAGLAPGSHTLTVRYAGDDHHAEATTTVTLDVRKVASTTSATITPGTVQVGRGRATLAVSVDAGDLGPTGTVVAIVDGEQVASTRLSDGRATLRVGPFDQAGTRSITVRYSGDDQIAASSTTATVEVSKAEARVSVTHKPRKVRAVKTAPSLTVRVRADGVKPRGWVAIQLAGQPDQRKRLNKNGKVRFKLVAFGGAGDKVVTVVYEGNDRVKGVSVEHIITVRPRN